jgi:hypothetical protein
LGSPGLGVGAGWIGDGSGGWEWETGDGFGVVGRGFGGWFWRWVLQARS